jgi:hypothetical protein
VARRNRRQEEVLGVVPGGISPEVRVGAPGNVRLLRDEDAILPVITIVRRGPLSTVSFPYQAGRVAMLVSAHAVCWRVAVADASSWIEAMGSETIPRRR